MTADPALDLGARIRARRQALGLSIEALAKASDVSPAMLSEVERSVKNPTVRIAYQIARGLGCSLTDLLDDAPIQPVRLVRADERRKLIDPDSQVIRYGLSSRSWSPSSGLLGDNLEIAWYELPPRASTGPLGPNRPGVIEVVVVLGGTLSFELGGVSYQLERNDSIVYGPQRATEYRNDADSTCEFMLIGSHSRASTP